MMSSSERKFAAARGERRKKAAVSDDQGWLPDEMIMEVLLRLPAKSLLRFRAACRSWAALFSSEQFCGLHMATPKAAPPRLLFVSPAATSDSSTTEVCSVSLSAGPEDDLKLFTLDSACGDSMQLLMPAPCHGLNLLLDAAAPAYYVCNAATRAVARLPVPPFPRLFVHASAGLGFDARTRRYKVVRLIRGDHDDIESIWCEVYTHGDDVVGGGCPTDSWRMPAGGGVPLGLRRFAGAAVSDARSHNLPPVFANGFLHWSVHPLSFSKRPRAAVISFSLADETFDFIGPPPFWASPAPLLASDPESIPYRDAKLEGHLVQMDNQLCMVRDLRYDGNGGYVLEVWKLPDGSPGGAWSLYHDIHLFGRVARDLRRPEVVRVIGTTAGSGRLGKKIMIATSEHMICDKFQKKVTTMTLALNL
ncbi:F-box/kelch-repeat protein [Hordeum vulgare]|nr:F-box/kelch-repeat protein [Hordeum vulgare]